MKTKTCAIILNCNLPDYTDMLYDSLKPYEREDYELFVLDNGSTPEGTSKYTTFKKHCPVISAAVYPPVCLLPVISAR